MTSEQEKIVRPSWDCELCGLTELFNEKENSIEKIDAKVRDTKNQEFIMDIPLEEGNERPQIKKSTKKSTTKTSTKKTTTKKTTTRATKKKDEDEMVH